MHPELLNNSIFLKYYRKWQEDPASIVFAPVAEYFMRYGLYADAEAILTEGLKNHPRFVSGHRVYAKLMILRHDFERAEAAIEAILSLVPGSPQAKELIAALESAKGVRPEAQEGFRQALDVGAAETASAIEDVSEKEIMPASEAESDETGSLEDETFQSAPNAAPDVAPAKSERIPSWETVTMANIYSAQGHFEKARKIYESILSREPGNEAAMRGLRHLSLREAAGTPAQV